MRIGGQKAFFTRFFDGLWFKTNPSGTACIVAPKHHQWGLSLSRRANLVSKCG